MPEICEVEVARSFADTCSQGHQFTKLVICPRENKLKHTQRALKNGFQFNFPQYDRFTLKWKRRGKTLKVMCYNSTDSHTVDSSIDTTQPLQLLTNNIEIPSTSVIKRIESGIPPPNNPQPSSTLSPITSSKSNSILNYFKPIVVANNASLPSSNSSQTMITDTQPLIDSSINNTQPSLSNNSLFVSVEDNIQLSTSTVTDTQSAIISNNVSTVLPTCVTLNISLPLRGQILFADEEDEETQFSRVLLYSNRWKLYCHCTP